MGKLAACRLWSEGLMGQMLHGFPAGGFRQHAVEGSSGLCSRQVKETSH